MYVKGHESSSLEYSGEGDESRARPIIRVTEVGVHGVSKIHGGLAVDGLGSELRATQVGVGEVGPAEVDAGVAVGVLGNQLRATQVGVGEVGSDEVDDGAVVFVGAFVVFVVEVLVGPSAVGNELRATQVGVGERLAPLKSMVASPARSSLPKP